MRIIADHLRASVFILGDERGVTPSNVDQGYILRRFIRRMIRHLRTLELPIEEITINELAKLLYAAQLRPLAEFGRKSIALQRSASV